MMSDEWVVLAEIDWYPNTIVPTVSAGIATGYYSPEGLSAPTVWYKDVLLSVSDIDREVSVIPREASIASCTIELSNIDLEFSKIIGQVPIAGRTVRVKFGRLSDGLIGQVTVFTGQISKWAIRDNTLILTVRDHSYEALGQTLSGMLNVTDFPNMPVDQPTVLVPYFYGRYGDSAAPGVMPAYMIDPALGGATYVYLLSRHSPPAAVTVWPFVDDVAYGGVWNLHTAHTFGQYTDCMVIEFDADPAGVVTWSCSTTTKIAPGEIIEDFLTDLGIGSLDTTALDLIDTELGASAIAGLWVGGSGSTVQEQIDRICETFSMYAFRTRAGLFSVVRPLIEHRLSPSISAVLDENDIKNLVIESTDAAVSRLQYNYRYCYDKDYFQLQPSPTEWATEQDIGQSVRDSFNLWAVYYSAEPLMAERRYMMREDVRLASFTVPPAYYNLDLCQYVQLTHWQGPEGAGAGYRTDLARIYRISLQCSLRNPQVSLGAIMLPTARPVDLLGDNQSPSIWLDAQRQLTLADGDACASWTDFSGKSLNVAQATGANKPLMKRAVIGTRPVMRFEADNASYFSRASSTYLRSGSSDYIGWAWFAVVHGATGANQTILCKGDGAMGTATEYAWQLDRFFVRGSWYAVDFAVDGEPHILVASFDGVTQKIRWFKDGDKLGETAAITDPYATTLTEDFFVGKLGSGATEYYDGDIAELFLIRNNTGAAIADKWRWLLEEYLSEKYGIAVVRDAA